MEKTVAINCYYCAPGTDGCGPSFRTGGAGVVSTSDSSAVYCTVCICSYFRNISTSFLCRKQYILATTMLLRVAMLL